MLEPVAVVVPDAPERRSEPRAASRRRGSESALAARGVVVLAADLPALRPEALAAALELAGQHPRAVVADAGGTGTVLLAAGRGVALEPSFGPGSRQRHLESGAVDLTDTLPPGDPTEGLRHDVDTAADLETPRSASGSAPRTATYSPRTCSSPWSGKLRP